MTTTAETEPTYLFGPRDRRALLLGHAAAPGAAGRARARRPAPRAALREQLARGSVWRARPRRCLALPSCRCKAGRSSTGSDRSSTTLTAASPARRPTSAGRGRCTRPPTAARELALPGIAARVRVRCVRRRTRRGRCHPAGQPMDRRLQVTAPAYPLADRVDPAGAGPAWGSLLAQLGQEGSKVAAVQWLERTIPDSGRGLEDWWQAKGDPTASSAEPYRALIADAGPAATRHETFVAVSIDERRCRRAIRAAAVDPTASHRCSCSELAWVEAGLRRGDVQVVAWLGADDLAGLSGPSTTRWRRRHRQAAARRARPRSAPGRGRPDGGTVRPSPTTGPTPATTRSTGSPRGHACRCRRPGSIRCWCSAVSVAPSR